MHADRLRHPIRSRRTIRPLPALLLAFLLALCALVAGYAGLVSWNREPLPLAAEKPDLTVDAVDLPPPTALPALRPEVQPVEAVLQEQPFPLRPRRGRLLVDLPTAAPEGAGVAVLDQRSGALLAWRVPAASTMPTTLDFEDVPVGEHHVVLALAPHLARWSYLARARGEVAPATSPARVTLRTTTQSLALHLQDDRQQPLSGVVVTLQRADDRGWVWRLPEPALSDGFVGPDLAMTDAQGNVAFAPLGAGRYRVHVEGLQPVDAEPALVVPGPAQVSVTLRPR